MTKVLLIENDEADASLIQSALESVGLDVTTVDDGNKGLLKARLMRPAMILLAVELEGTSGYIICQKVKRDLGLRRIPLFIMSKDDNAEETFTQHATLPRRADEYILKPFNARHLLERVANYIEIELPEPGAPDESYQEPTDTAVTQRPHPSAPSDEDIAVSDAMESFSISDGPMIEEIEMPADGDMIEFDVVDDIQMEDIPSDLNIDMGGGDIVVDEISIGEVSIEPEPEPEPPSPPTPAEPEQATVAVGSTDFMDKLLEKDALIAELRSQLAEAQATAASTPSESGEDGEVVAQLREEVETLKDIELTQQETIDRLVSDNEELRGQVERLGQMVAEGGGGEGDEDVSALKERISFLEEHLTQLLSALETARSALNSVLE